MYKEAGEDRGSYEEDGCWPTRGSYQTAALGGAHTRAHRRDWLRPGVRREGVNEAKLEASKSFYTRLPGKAEDDLERGELLHPATITD